MFQLEDELKNLTKTLETEMVEQMQGKAVNELRSIVDEAEIKGEYLEDLNDYLQESVLFLNL